jgi:hypothetical protein
MKNRYFKLIDKLIVFMLLAIIGIRASFYIQTLKDAIGKILLIVGFDVSASLKNIYVSYLDKQSIVVLWCTIIVSLVYNVIYYMFIGYNNRKMNSSLINSKDEFTRSLYNYLENDEKRCYVISGEWGVGKTYTLGEFLKKYLRYSTRKKVYNISCFGISSRDELINEIKLTYEREDNRAIVKLNDFIKAIPILGDGIYNIIKPRYELKDMKKKAIFVFDDFERITQSTILENDNRFYHNPIHNSSVKELNEIHKRIDKLTDEMTGFRRNNSNMMIQPLLEKYNIVAGLINELIEIYDMKVIVVCNTDKISPKFYFDIFNEKLAAIKFNIEGKNNFILRLIVEKTESIKSMPDDKKIQILGFFTTNMNMIRALWKDTGFSNLRILSGIITAFIDLVDRIELDDILSIEKDVFYSIFVGHIAYYSNTMGELQNIEIGENLILKFKKYELSFTPGYGSQNNNWKWLESKGIDNNVKWAGSNISFTWILGNVIEITRIKSNLQTLKEKDSTVEELLLRENVEKKDLINKFSECTGIDIEDLLYGLYLIDKSNVKINDDEILKILKNTKIIYSEVPSRGDKEDVQIRRNLTLNLLERYKFSSLIFSNEEIKQIIFTGIRNTFLSVQAQKTDMNNQISASIIGINKMNLIQQYEKWLEESKNSNEQLSKSEVI